MPGKTWVHWILFNIPATVEYIVENEGAVGQEVAFMQGATDFNNAQQWRGPCPPRPSLKASEGTANGTHHYHFTLYALDTMLDLPAGITKEQLLSAMHGHILEQTTLIGTYQRRK
jgi:Raf kinase inhibitor-like YbhB/YbcL family protein